MNASEIIKQLNHYYQVYITDEDIKLFNKYLYQLPATATVLEIGTGWGKSTTAMALSNQHIIIDTVDTGEFQIACGWAKNKEDYRRKVQGLWRRFQVKNINLILKDWFKFTPTHQYDAIHIDSIASLDAKVLERYLPYLREEGILFVRNYFRFKKEADKLLKGFQYLENREFMQVVRK
jgi:predicted O-methyltransferase YrrM